MLLLAIVLLIPGGIAELLDFKNRRPLETNRAIVPRPDLLKRLLGQSGDPGTMELKDVALSFGGVRAIDGLDLTIRPAEIHGLIGPNGSGKTTTLNVISGYYMPQNGTATLKGVELTALAASRPRAHAHRAHVPDPAYRRRSLGDRERDDRRHDRRHRNVP